MIRILETVVRGLSAASYALGAVLVGIMMVHITAHVFFQYVFRFPLPGTILFISHYYMVVVTFLCLAAVDLKDGHVSVELVTGMLPAKLQKVIAGIGFLVTALVFSLLAWQSFLTAEASRAAGAFAIEYDIKILIWPSYYIVPLGSGFFAFTSLVRFLFLVTGQQLATDSSKSDLLKEL